VTSDFGVQLREARRRLGLSQRALAERSDVHQPTIAAIETGRRSPSDHVRAQLEGALRVRPSVALASHRRAVIDAIERHHGTAAMVFGSVARGDDTPDSDLDLIVTFPEGADLLDVMDLTDEIEAIIGVRVDIASGRAVGAVMDRARREAVPL
jgi:predicted nucleotidyltransferase